MICRLNLILDVVEAVVCGDIVPHMPIVQGVQDPFLYNPLTGILQQRADTFFLAIDFHTDKPTCT